MPKSMTSNKLAIKKIFVCLIFQQIRDVRKLKGKEQSVNAKLIEINLKIKKEKIGWNCSLINSIMC